MYKGKKKFIGVEFLDGSHSVVPQVWLTVKNKCLKTYWPDVSVSRKTCREPEEKWPLHNVTKILAESGNYAFFF